MSCANTTAIYFQLMCTASFYLLHTNVPLQQSLNIRCLVKNVTIKLSYTMKHFNICNFCDSFLYQAIMVFFYVSDN